MTIGTLARGFLLEPVTHSTDAGICSHLLAAVAGRVVEIDLDDKGDPFILRETHRGPIKHSPRKSGNYHFNAGITIHCLTEPFTIWLAPHPTDTDLHRPEHIRLLPEGDDDWRNIRGIRSDAEGTWSQLKRTLIDLHTFAILNNAYTEAAHSKRSPVTRRLRSVTWPSAGRRHPIPLAWDGAYSQRWNRGVLGLHSSAAH